LLDEEKHVEGARQCWEGLLDPTAPLDAFLEANTGPLAWDGDMLQALAVRNRLRDAMFGREPAEIQAALTAVLATLPPGNPPPCQARPSLAPRPHNPSPSYFSSTGVPWYMTPLAGDLQQGKVLLRQLTGLRYQGRVLAATTATLPRLEAYIAACGEAGYYGEEVGVAVEKRDAILKAGAVGPRAEWFAQWRSYLAHLMAARDLKGLEHALEDLQVRTRLAAGWRVSERVQW
jgi:hypothetical protein